MMQAHPLNAEQAAQAWLKQTSKQARSWQLGVFAIRLAQLAAQISAFWFFTQPIHLIIVEQQAVSFNQLLPFVASAGVWALCACYSDFLAYKAKMALEADLETGVHKTLHVGQVAITRKYSATFWQQLLLTNLTDIGDYLTQYSIQKWLAGVGPLVVLLVIFPINYVVALTLLVTMPIVPLFMILVGQGAASLHRKHFVALERLGDIFSDRLKGLSLITATGQHRNQLERLDNASNIVNRKTMNVVSLAFLSTTVLDFFSTVSIALVAVFIGFTMLGELSIGPEISLQQGLFMLLVAPLLFSELRALGRFYHQKAKAEAGAERFASIEQEQQSRTPNKHAENITWINFQVSAPQLQANQLTISPGDWILLTGASGSGKTALLEALMGFRQASHSLSSDAAVLSQHACVLDNTVAFNLHLGRDNFSNQALEQSLAQVGLTDWLQNLPSGLSTQLGDCPALSGGEAQRLGLARILLLGKKVVLLDEPTAHLTDQQHQQLAALICAKLKNKTVIWASHKTLPSDWFSQHWVVADGEIEVSK